MRQLILKNKQAVGDAVVMTAAIRDLQQRYPGQFQIDVDTSFPEVWHNNPHLTKLPRLGTDVLTLGYSRAIKQSNLRSGHFMGGFHQHLSELLQLRVPLSALRPDIHLSAEEADPTRCRIQGPYVLINAGGKADVVTKMWGVSRWQKVVDLLSPDIRVVQVGRVPVGAPGVRVPTHYHTSLRGVVDLINKTSVRELIGLCAHASAIASCVTAVMHIAAAFNRPAVVVDGGREPWWWEAYNLQTWGLNVPGVRPEGLREHRYLTTIGRLPCCAERGCWKSSLGEKGPANSCERVVAESDGKVPECLLSIEPEQVAQEIRKALAGEPAPTLRQPAKLRAPLHLEPLAPLLVVRKSTEQQRREAQRSRKKLPAPAKLPARAPVIESAPPVTICVLTYGDYPPVFQRCVASILRATSGFSVDLRIGLNAVSPRVRAYADGIRTTSAAELYVSDQNMFKYPMMRRMLWERKPTTDWMVWFDDDSHVVAADWYPKLLAVLRSASADVLGRTFFYNYKPGQQDWVRQASWYRGRPFHTRVCKGGAVVDKIDFVTGGCWAARTRVILDAGWPDPRLRNNGGDVFFGEACNQVGAGLYRYDYGVAISDHARRGVTHPFPSA